MLVGQRFCHFDCIIAFDCDHFIYQIHVHYFWNKPVSNSSDLVISEVGAAGDYCCFVRLYRDQSRLGILLSDGFSNSHQRSSCSNPSDKRINSSIHLLNYLSTCCKVMREDIVRVTELVCKEILFVTVRDLLGSSDSALETHFFRGKAEARAEIGHYFDSLTCHVLWHYY